MSVYSHCAEMDLDGFGAITVGLTEVLLRSDRAKISTRYRIRSDFDNAGAIYIGKSGVLSDGSNDFVKLDPGDEIMFPYNDNVNQLYAISDTAGQTIRLGVLLAENL